VEVNGSWWEQVGGYLVVERRTVAKFRGGDEGSRFR